MNGQLPNLLTFFAAIAAGWAVFWLGAYPMYYLQIAIVFIAQGYVIGRVHQRFRKTVLLAFFCMFTLAPAWWNISHRLVNAVRYPSGAWLESAVMQLFVIALKLASLAVGGLWLAQLAKGASQPRTP